jgi:hypothetical protein
LEEKYKEIARKETASEAEQALALQEYLVFGILACVPDRQRTIRELQHGTTLIKTAEGNWVIRSTFSPAQHPPHC